MDGRSIILRSCGGELVMVPLLQPGLLSTVWYGMV